MFANSLIFVRVNSWCKFLCHRVVTRHSNWAPDKRTLTEMKPSYTVLSAFRGKSSGLSFTSSMLRQFRPHLFFFGCCFFFFSRFPGKEEGEAEGSRRNLKIQRREGSNGTIERETFAFPYRS